MPVEPHIYLLAKLTNLVATLDGWGIKVDDATPGECWIFIRSRSVEAITVDLLIVDTGVGAFLSNGAAASFVLGATSEYELIVDELVDLVQGVTSGFIVERNWLDGAQASVSTETMVVGPEQTHTFHAGSALQRVQPPTNVVRYTQGHTPAA